MKIKKKINPGHKDIAEGLKEMHEDIVEKKLEKGKGGNTPPVSNESHKFSKRTV